MVARTHQLSLSLDPSPWIESRDGDADCRALYRRHYSYRPYADRRDPALFVGPGGKLVLIAKDGASLFAWRRFIDDALIDGVKQRPGVCCAVFRKEGPGRASDLILAAEPYALGKWPGTARFYTYVDPSKVRHKRDPGRCFLRAGYRKCGTTAGGLVCLDKSVPS